MSSQTISGGLWVAAVISMTAWATAAHAEMPDVHREAAADIDAFVRRAMTHVEAVPGLALTVVDGDEILITAGYGVADVRTGAKVDADTGFYIASATKAFTALSFAAMATRGETDLDEPVGAWASRSGLSPEMAQATSLTDLLSHRAGLDNEAITFRAAYSGEHSPQVIQGLLARTQVNAETPHGVFRYTNLGYNLATILLEAQTGRDWRDMVKEEVLAPAGMSRTTARISQAQQGGVVAEGHFGDGPTPVVSPLQKVDATMQSAGGLISTAHDMARWLEVQLNDGVIDGRRVFPEGLILSTHTSRVAQDRRFGVYRRGGYGLGWQTGRYGRDVLIHHFGNFAGSRAHVSFMPERRIGVAVMINEDQVAGELADITANCVYDRLAGRADLETAYEAELIALVQRRDQRRAALIRARAERAARPWRLSQPNSAYVGIYENPAYGTMEVIETPSGLDIKMGVMRASAEAFTEAESLRVELVPFQGRVIVFNGPDALTFEGERFIRRP